MTKSFQHFLVDLDPIGITYRHETNAIDKRDAVHHTLYSYFQSRDKMRLFIWRQKEEYGEEQWNYLVDKMAEEESMAGPPPEPEPEKTGPNQLDLFAFDRYTDKAHPGTDIARAWKINNKMVFMDFDRMSEMIGDATATFSAKMDGELVCIYYEGGKTVLVTPRGTIRTNMPPTDEASELLAGNSSAAFLGEIYAVDESGKPQSYMQSVKKIKSNEKNSDQYMRVAVFDVHQIDGKECESWPIEEKDKKIKEIFGPGKTIHPVLMATGTLDKGTAMWNALEKNGWEGMVIHFSGQLYKIKPLQSYDLVVVGINKSAKFMGQVSAAVCAFMDKEGRYRMSAKVSGGFDDQDRIDLLEWAERNKVAEDDKMVWVDPLKDPLIVEVQAVEVNQKMMPAMEFKEGKWLTLENQMSATLRFPKFKMEREDKDPVNKDIGLEQVNVEGNVVQASPVIPALEEIFKREKKPRDEVWTVHIIRNKDGRGDCLIRATNGDQLNHPASLYMSSEDRFSNERHDLQLIEMPQSDWRPVQDAEDGWNKMKALEEQNPAWGEIRTYKYDGGMLIQASPVIPALEEAFPDEPRLFEMGDRVKLNELGMTMYSFQSEGRSGTVTRAPSLNNDGPNPEDWIMEITWDNNHTNHYRGNQIERV